MEILECNRPHCAVVPGVGVVQAADPNVPSDWLMTHAAPVPMALKLPLLCARAMRDPNVAIRIVTARTDINLFICLLRCFRNFFLFAVILVDLIAAIGRN
jgi:hypothetical protein